jgi:hypothetical protein
LAFVIAQPLSQIGTDAHTWEEIDWLVDQAGYILIDQGGSALLVPGP